MPAVIESTLYTSPGGPVVSGSTQQNSREDALLGYQVVLNSVHVATTYSWTLSFASDSPGNTTTGSLGGTSSLSALLAPEGSTSRTARFNIDHEGCYLVRLVVDSGLTTEDTQFIRVRVLTVFGSLKFVAAGERRDDYGVIPVDATAEGWANDQNANLQRLALLLRRHALSGRVLFVDSNRGRSSSYSQNDPTNVIALPGPVSSRKEETGMRMRATGHGDFSSINEAIAYALAAASRGEPAPSATEPYYVVIRPGLYTEDLNLAPFVHLIGDSDFPALSALIDGVNLMPVRIRTLNTAGTGTHRFNPLASHTTASLLLANLSLETTQDSTQPVLDLLGGLTLIRSCVIWQQGNAASQGAAVSCSVSNPSYAPRLFIEDSVIQSSAATSDRVALYFDAIGGACTVTNVSISGVNAVQVNESLYTTCTFAAERTSIAGVQPYVGYASDQSFVETTFSRPSGSSPAVDVKPFGSNAAAVAGTMAGTCNLTLTRCTLDNTVRFRSSISSSTTSLITNACAYAASVTGPRILLPDAPGDLPDTFATHLQADSIQYVPDYHDPLLGTAATATVPVANRSPRGNVQEVLDLIFRALFPVTGSPFFSLDSAYDGVASLSPFTLGVGLGRTITANGGAVAIRGASYPIATEDESKEGGLQVEGMVDIGGLINGSGSIVDVGHSEIGLIPDLTGGGPYIGLGRARWLNGVTSNDRGFMGASVVAGANNTPAAPSSMAPYHLHLRAAPLVDSGTGGAGHIFVVPGSVTDDAASIDPGSLFLMGGNTAVNGAIPSSVWVVPGTDEGFVNPGAVYLTGGGHTPATYRFGAYVGGVAGILYIGTPAGAEGITFDGTESLADATALFAAGSRLVTASQDGTYLSLHSDPGPAGDITILGDDQGGALITALGGAGTFTAGTLGDKIALDVPSDGYLRCDGDFEVTGSLIATVTDGNAIHDNVDGEINALATKASPVAGDVFVIEDSADSFSKKKVLFSALGGSATDSDAIHDNVDGEINAITTKVTPESADILLIEDSADSFSKKKITIGSLPSGGGGGGSGLGTYINVTNAMSPYAPGAGEAVFEANTSTGDVEITLPDAMSTPDTVFIFQIGSGTGTFTLTPQGLDSVGGVASFVLEGIGQAVALYSDGTSNWRVWSEYTPPAATVRFVSSDITWASTDQHKIYSVQLFSGADTTITLPTDMPVGRTLTVKDQLGLANATPSPGGQRIIIMDDAGGTFDGAATLEITTAYGAVTLYKNDGGNWSII